MFSYTAFLFKGQYKTRLKTRMVGYVEKVCRRKIRNCFVALRSEANTGYFRTYMKTDAELLDQTRKIQRVKFDPVVGRMCVHKECKLKGPFLLKSHIAIAKS